MRILLIIIAVLTTQWPAVAGGSFDLYPALWDTLIGGHYDAARLLCTQMDSSLRGHPAATQARAAILYGQMIDYEDTSGRSEFLALTDQCVHECDTWDSEHPEMRAELAYLKGSALSARGLLLHREGNVLDGVRLLMAARGAFDAAIEADSQFYDAYLGRGAYRCAVARYASLFEWLPFVPSAESGRQDMWIAASRSRFSRYSALSSLAWLALDSRNWNLADSICTVGLTRFPNSRTFLWPKLALMVRQEKWNEAETIARSLLEQYLALENTNGYETTGLNWRLMICADSLGRPDDAVAYARAGLAAHRTEDVARRRKDKIRDMERRLAQSDPSSGE